MPSEGEVRYGREIGKRPPNVQFRYHRCVNCPTLRWVNESRYKLGLSRLCADCARKNARRSFNGQIG